MDNTPNRAGSAGTDPLAPVTPAQMAASRAQRTAQPTASTPAAATQRSAASADVTASQQPLPQTQQPTQAMPSVRTPERRGPIQTTFVPGNSGLDAAITGTFEPLGDDSEKPRRSHRAVFIGLGVAVGVLAIAYAAGVFVFSGKYYPGTKIGGIDVSMNDAATAAQLVENSVGSYSLSVSGLGFTWDYTPEPGTFSVDADAEAEAVLAANEPLLWPIKLISGMTGNDTEKTADDEGAAFVVTYDEAGLEAGLGAAIDEFNASRPGTFDTAGAFDEATGQFSVEKARSNQRLSRDAIITAVKDAVSRAETTVELDDSMYEPLAGGATDEQLQAACDAANEIIGVNVTLKYGDTPIATLDGKTMTQWITFDEALNPVLNSDGLSGWIRDLAVNALDTVGTERTWTRADGKQCTVSGGTYGWVSDEAALAQLIQDAVANKQTGDIQVPTKQTADVYHGMGQRDWASYVDIDLTEQWVRYYDANDNVIWESGCITGSPIDNNYTPTGIYFLNSNNGGATLTGADEDGDGEPDYRTPVNYWMPFIGGAVGLHDADWQASSSFGDPTAYQWTGSHGCVNLPPEKAAELSSIITVGTCVITHY